MLTTGLERVVPRRWWSRAPVLLSGLGGVGLLTCATCTAGCTLSLLGAIGLAGGLAAITGVLRLLSAALLVIGLGVGAVGFARRCWADRCCVSKKNGLLSARRTTSAAPTDGGSPTPPKV